LSRSVRQGGEVDRVGRTQSLLLSEVEGNRAHRHRPIHLVIPSLSQPRQRRECA